MADDVDPHLQAWIYTGSARVLLVLIFSEVPGHASSTRAKYMSFDSSATRKPCLEKQLEANTESC